MKRAVRTRSWRVAPLLLIALLFGCASDLKPGQTKDDPQVKLAKLLDEWRKVRDGGGTCASGGRRYPYIDCGRIQAGIERLVLEFPTHPEVLLVNAVVAFQTAQPDKAESYLDDLLEQEPRESGAVVLRSRLAIQKGNLPRARRLLDQQILLRPDAADVREAMASVHYLERDFDLAWRELAIAERLGAPTWRIAFNRGLLEEAEGRIEAAISHFRITVEENPEYEPARSRLLGLESERGL